MISNNREHPLYPLTRAIRLKFDSKNTAQVDKKKKDNTELTFISYAHINDNTENKEIVSTLAEEMRTSGINVFFDKFNFIPGVDWEESANEAISSSKCKKMLCIVSKEYFKSESCRLEIEKCLSLKKKTLIFYDLFGELDSIDDEFFNTIKSKKNVKIVKNRLELIKLYKLRTLEENMRKRVLFAKYDILTDDRTKKVFPEDYKKSNNISKVSVRRNKQNIYASVEGKEYPVKYYNNNVYRYFLNNEEIKIFESKSAERMTYDYRKLYKTVKQKAKWFALKPSIILSLILVIISLVYYISLAGIDEITEEGYKFGFVIPLPETLSPLLHNISVWAVFFFIALIFFMIILTIDFRYTAKRLIYDRSKVLKNILRIPMFVFMLPIFIISLIYERKIRTKIIDIKRDFDQGNASYVQVIERKVK